jgi:hypothetical protein
VVIYSGRVKFDVLSESLWANRGISTFKNMRYSSKTSFAVASVIGFLFSAAAWSQSVEAPIVSAGDTWVYRTTTEKGQGGWTQTRDEIATTRVTASTIFTTVKTVGSTQAPKDLYWGRDWSRARDVNGKETVVNRPLRFPLSVGDSWDLSYTEQNPNQAHKFENLDNKYVVVGVETVEVPAGKFKAFKIESEGRWRAELAPKKAVAQAAQVNESGTTMVTQAQNTEPKEVSGRTYKAVWYVPEIKRWVKSVEEYYSTLGVRNERYTAELESFKPADEAGLPSDAAVTPVTH